MAACSAPNPKDKRHKVGTEWANCSLIGGALVAAGASCVAGVGFATGAAIAGSTCAYAKYYRGEEFAPTASWEVDDIDDWFPETRVYKFPKLIIQFNFDSYELSDYEKEKLADIVENARDRKKIILSGYTCNVGNPAYNIYLSELRARAVRAYLIKNGVKPWSIEYKGYGSANPISPNTSKKGRKANRRVEVDTQ